MANSVDPTVLPEEPSCDPAERSAPNWRYLRARAFAEGRRHPLVDEAPALLRQATIAIRRRRAQPLSVARDPLGHALRLGEPEYVEEASWIEALALARMSADRAARVCGASSQAIACYLQLFYDLERRGATEHSMWTRYVAPERRRGDPRTAAERTTRKILAWAAGTGFDRIYGIDVRGLNETPLDSLRRRLMIRELDCLAALCDSDEFVADPKLTAKIEAVLERLAPKFPGETDPQHASVGIVAQSQRAVAGRDLQEIISGGEEAPPSGLTADEVELQAALDRRAEDLQRWNALSEIAAWRRRLEESPTDSSDGDARHEAPPALVKRILPKKSADRQRLLATGYFTGIAGKPQLLPSLLERASTVTAFRAADGQTSALAAAGRPASALSLLEMLLRSPDIEQRLALGRGVLLTTWEAAEAWQWHDVGFAAAPVADLASDLPRQAPRIRRALVQSRAQFINNEPDALVDSNTSDQSVTLDVILVAPSWDLATGAMKAGADRERLATIGQALYDVDPLAWGGLAEWRPPAELARTLRSHSAARDRDATLRRLAESLAKHVLFPAPASDAAAADVTTLGDARERLLRAAAGHDRGTAAWGGPRAAFLEVGEATLIAPLLEQLARCNDPLLRVRWSQLARLKRRSLELEADALIASAGDRDRGAVALVRSMHEELASVDKQLLEVAKGLPIRRLRRATGDAPHAAH